MNILDQKNRNRQMSIKIDEDTYDAITDAMRDHLKTKDILRFFL